MSTTLTPQPPVSTTQKPVSSSVPAPTEKATSTTQAPTNPPVTSTTVKPPAVIPITSAPEPAKKPNTTETDDVKKIPEPQPHHILGGIAIPIFLVILIVGSVFAVKKYDLIERARDVMRNRRYHANYETVGNTAVFDADDDDDPPLLA